MSVVEDLLKNVPIPKMLPIEQSFDETHIPAEEIPQRIEEQLAQEKISGKLRPGMEVAITVGSRGVANIALIVRSIADSLKRRSVKPFAVPAMGSHGGATAEGQRRVIEGYGVTEEYIGCPIRSSMETEEIGRAAPSASTATPITPTASSCWGASSPTPASGAPMKAA